MEMFSMLKHHIVADGANPITEHFHLVRQVASAGQQHVWKIYDAKRIKDGKVQNILTNKLPLLKKNCTKNYVTRDANLDRSVNILMADLSNEEPNFLKYITSDRLASGHVPFSVGGSGFRV